MMTNSAMQWMFVFLAFLVQGILLFNFATRYWKPSIEREYGWLIYAMGFLGLILGVVLAFGGQPWYFVAAPLLYAVWSAFGYSVDVSRRIPWRNPRRWSIFIPYVALFILTQVSFWIPLWYVGLGYWIAYTALYVLNTGLNIFSHRLSTESLAQS